MVTKVLFPRPDFKREEWMNLNGKWEFSFDAPVYNKTINVPYPWGSELSGITEAKDGTGFYRRRVKWSPKGRRIFIIFGAVDCDCSVKVNGKLIGTHRGGYDQFEFEVTSLWDRNGENTIEAEATDIADRSRLYGKQGYGDAKGIWQTPWLEARPDGFISGFFVKTALDGTVTYDIETTNAPDGAKVSFEGFAGEAVIENNKACLTLKVADPKLWTPEAPHLYEGALTLTAGGEIDRVETYFGIKEISTEKFGKNGNRYITLNGKPYYINGVLDQSFNPKGFFTLPTDGDCLDEIQRLKDIGINMCRVHIKAEEPLKLYYADKLGMLIMEDIPCFWGEPSAAAKAQYEVEMEAQMLRDRNHPSVFCWVIFNETWGLMHFEKDAEGKDVRVYRPETAEWVVECYHKAKALDPTRLVEDKSPCNHEHTVTDIHTWHPYSHGHENVKRIVDTFCDKAYVGSQNNYKEGYTMGDVPVMNSECGNVWGIIGGSGESDISWQYKYMMNEFRLHDKLCGFVFTEFHDVINEFNGYYKLDNSKKDFGYEDFGFTLSDLHTQDYVGADMPPMVTVKPGDTVNVPFFVSSFTDKRHGKALTLKVELLGIDPLGEDATLGKWDIPVTISDYGTAMLPELTITAPEFDGIAQLRFALYDGGERVTANAVMLEIDAPRRDVLTIAPSDITASGFKSVISAICGEKLSGIGEGEMAVTVKLSDIPEYMRGDDIRLTLEASTRQPMSHDFDGCDIDPHIIDLNYMLGYKCDPGANPNSFMQTDETPYPGVLTVLANGKKIADITLSDCPADSRGALSHHYQPVVNKLDEAGSYGQMVDVTIPADAIAGSDTLTITLKASDSGLSVYSRKCGRYAAGINLSVKK